MASDTPTRVAVFGATSGIATAVARLYAGRGARLVLIGRDRAALEASAADLRTRGAAAVELVAADFAQPDRTIAAAGEAFAAFGGLDVAMVAYGSLPDQVAAQKEPAQLIAAIGLNLVSPVLLCEQLAARFEAQGHGALAVITSVAGNRGRQSNYIYGAAKGGLQRYLEGLRHRLHASAIAVTDIRPGFVRTAMTEHLPRGGPLWAEPGAVGAEIVRAIDGCRAVVYTPRFWRYIMWVVQALPRTLIHRTRL
ncbi:SDR family NAD(P)-dependent oxidoreductase [Blastochloris viridis]|uniref:Putative oxidoreductase n=1 Tax=Blastochloris viridis TaxID=1079 RepID=A0A0H5BHM4_BLAVI|nr:SDR family NAD(P)-dependent oxidoreductase [Blastochloris viridis]ALK10182.1 putative oxidoreductase [Blastochloris viridis]BAR99886.1 sorbitol-6-phosphate 2-dehydrogenase [Blastochloris viridis]CUU42846.1 putative oxidoreductase [Blastochloris viridis]